MAAQAGLSEPKEWDKAKACDFQTGSRRKAIAWMRPLLAEAVKRILREQQRNIDFLDRAVFNDRHLGKGKATPENALIELSHSLGR